MTLIGATVIVWTGAQGIPERFVWNGKRYRVTDQPTPLDIDYAAITHPSTMPLGWRFQGTSDTGESRMFDVLYDEQRREWQLLHLRVGPRGQGFNTTLMQPSSFF